MVPLHSGLSGLTIAEGMDMKSLSSFATGGKAEYYAEPKTIHDAVSLLEIAYAKNLPVTIIGAGTHILVSDSGIPGMVISTAGMKGMTIRGRLLVASPGESMENVINQAIDHNLVGLEKIAGIPGTIAGALSVNASANGSTLSDSFFYADYLTMDGLLRRRPGFHDYIRRQGSMFRDGEMIISVALLLEPSRASAEARVRKEEYVEKMYIPPARRFSGQIFRDSDAMSASDALKAAGLAGKSGLRAEFSAYQPNTILTWPGCTSDEIFELIRHAEKTVKEKLGITLERSLTILGSFRDRG